MGSVAKRVPDSFLVAYPGATYEVISPENYQAYLGIGASRQG